MPKTMNTAWFVVFAVTILSLGFTQPSLTNTVMRCKEVQSNTVKISEPSAVIAIAKVARDTAVAVSAWAVLGGATAFLFSPWGLGPDTDEALMASGTIGVVACAALNRVAQTAFILSSIVRGYQHLKAKAEFEKAKKACIL